MRRLLLSMTLLLALFGFAAAQGSANTGEVAKVDVAAGKLTLKHDGVKSLDMPAMTMAFRVSDPAMLKRFKPGDKVRFSVQKINGQYTITAIEAAL